MNGSWENTSAFDAIALLRGPRISRASAGPVQDAGTAAPAAHAPAAFRSPRRVMAAKVDILFLPARLLMMQLTFEAARAVSVRFESHAPSSSAQLKRFFESNRQTRHAPRKQASSSSTRATARA